jgi:hypothetical protein
LIENVRFNVINCGITEEIQQRIAVEGYLWGSDAESLQAHINGQKFDVMILSDTVSTLLPFPSIALPNADYRYLIIPSIFP